MMQATKFYDEMTIYNPSGIKIIDVRVSKNAIIKFVLMGDYYIQLPFSLKNQTSFPRGSYIIYKGRKFEIMSNVTPEFDNNTGGYKYTLNFWAQQNHMKRCCVQWLAGEVSETTFSDTTDLASFGNLIADNMNRFLGGTNWKVGAVPADLDKMTKLVSFAGDSCWDGLANIAKVFEVEWWTIENGAEVWIYFGKLELGSPERFERGEVVSSIPAKKGDDSNYGTRFFVFGSTRNIPNDYGNTQQGGVTNHVSEKRLHLPNGMQYIDAWENIASGDVVEKVVYFEDVYPKNTDTITDITTIKRKLEGSESSDTFDAYVMTCANTPFLPSDTIVGETLRCVFTSGSLKDQEFEIALIDNDNNVIDPEKWKPEDGFNKKFEVIAKTENSGDGNVLIIPNKDLHPEVGDTMVLTGIELPKERIAEAEQDLLKVGKSWAIKNSSDTNVYDCPTNPVYCQLNDKNYEAGQKVLLVGSNFGVDGRQSRIQGFEKKLYNEYIATYTVGDNTVYSRLGSIETNIKENQYAERIGVVSGVGIYIISRYDNTAPTDYNVFSALRSMEDFHPKGGRKSLDFNAGNINAAQDMTAGGDAQVGGNIESGGDISAGGNVDAKGSVTAQGNVESDADVIAKGKFATANFRKGNISGAGAGVYQDSTGSSVVEADKLIIRKEAVFNELIINQMSFRLGETVFSNGGFECTSVQEESTYYRCYYDNKNGTRYSGIVVGDQARCQRYSADNKSIIKYFWALVTGVGDDYVDISKTDKDGSGIPAEGDNIVQFGNRTDVARQSAIVIDARDGGSIQVLAKIDSFDLTDKNYIGIGVNPVTGRAYQYVYGDMFCGDRNLDDPEATYITFQQAPGDTKPRMRMNTDVIIGKNSSGLKNLSEWPEVKQDIDTAKDTAQDAKDAAAALNTTVTGLKNFTDEAFADGIVDRAEAASIEKYTNTVNETKESVDTSYSTVYNNTLLTGTAKTNLAAAKTAFDTAVANLLTSIQSASADGVATPTEKSDVDSKYDIFNTAYGTFNTRLEEANKYIQTAINTTAQGAYQLSQELQTAVNVLNDTIIPDLQSQIDGSITSYEGTEVPTLNNAPANEWASTEEKNRHIGDYYDRFVVIDGENVTERYKFSYQNNTYQWLRVADSGAAQALSEAREALGLAGTKAKLFYGDSTPAVPYSVNDIWIKTSGVIYVSNANKADGSTASESDWQSVNDAQLRLRQMASDSVISKEEKATLRNKVAQIDKEYASYQDDATTYSVSIADLSAAYNALKNFLSGTVAVNMDSDTTLTDAQRSSYNTYFANYDAEVSRFANLIADAMAKNAADAAVDAVQIGGVNILNGTKNFSDHWSGEGQILSEQYLGLNVVYCKVPTSADYAEVRRQVNVPFTPSEEYTLSFWAKGEGYVHTYCHPSITQIIIATNGDASVGSVIDAHMRYVLTSEWKRFFVTFLTLGTVSPSGDNRVLFRVHSGNNEVYLCGAKLEQGNKATAYSISDNDQKEYSDKALDALADIASDDKLTPNEKQDAKREWEIIQGEKPILTAQADTIQLSTADYLNVYNALSAYITPLLADMTTTSTITGSVFNARFKTYYDAKTTLLKNIQYYSSGQFRITTIDATALDPDTYYPVTFTLYNATDYKATFDIGTVLGTSGKPPWATHAQGFSCNCVWESNGNRWGTIPVKRYIHSFAYSFAGSTPVGSIGQVIEVSMEYIYVRGGGRYKVRTSGVPFIELHPSGYHWTSGSSSGDLPTRTSIETPVVNLDAAQKTAQEAKDAAASLNTTVASMKDFTDEAFADGIVDRAEAASIEKYINTVNETGSAADAAYGKLYNNPYLGGSAKTDLATKKSAFDAAKVSLLNAISAAIADGKASEAEVRNVNAQYTEFNAAYKDFTRAIEDANQAIQNELKSYSDAAQDAADAAAARVAELEFLKSAFSDMTTEISDGLLLTGFVGVRDSASNIVAGLSGINPYSDLSRYPILFGGATSAKAANDAKFRFYSDGYFVLGGDRLVFEPTNSSLTVRGTIYASSGEFRGKVYASGGEFTGKVVATSGEFTGIVHASAGEFTGTITASSGKVGDFVIDSGNLLNTKNSGNIKFTYGESYVQLGNESSYNNNYGNLTISAKASSGLVRAISVGAWGGTDNIAIDIWNGDFRLNADAKIRGIATSTKYLFSAGSTYLTREDDYIEYNGSGTTHIYLPPTNNDGKVIWIKKSGSGNVIVHAYNATHYIRMGSGPVKDVTINWNSECKFTFINSTKFWNYANYNN
nr:MAG TPA: Minor structural protein putative tail fiber [Caudoviricetes sp.]